MIVNTNRRTATEPFSLDLWALMLLFERRGPGTHLRPEGEGWNVLETIAIILIVLWLLGMVSGYTLGNFIWVLLVIAVVLFLVRLVSGRRVV
jgi:hypothetical protein